MIIPPLDLKRQYKTIKKEILGNIHKVCDEQAFILGKTVSDFEKNIASYCDTKYAVGCASGTDAIILSLIVAGIGKGDEVIVPSFTFIASAEPIASLGAKPVFCDIDGKTYNATCETIEKKITSKTKAIVIVHLYGQVVDMKPINRLARKHKLVIIEDACQAIGALYGPTGDKAGSMGDFGCFSFFPSKNLGGFGDGGMIVTNTKKRANMLLMLRQHGSCKRYYHDFLGRNSRLDALQAVVLNTKLAYLDEWIKERNKKAAQYDRLFKKHLGDNVVLPYVEHGNLHTYHQYVIRIKGFSRKKRDALITHLKKHGIGVNVYYPVPCHMQKCFSYLNYSRGDLPVTELASQTTLSLPIYPELTGKEQKYVVEKIKEYVGKSV